MKKALILSGVACLVFAYNADRNFDGYSYFAVGVEHFSYTEKFVYTFNSYYVSPYSGKVYAKDSQVSVKSKMDVSSPVYLSGGLIRINPKWDLSMDFVSTLKPHTATEEWLDRGDDSVIYKNYATIMSNSMKFLMHYKLTNVHRLTFGFSYILNTFKRFSGDATSTTLVEETSSTATLNAGYWYESNTAAKEGIRVKYQINFGLPVYQHVENTAAPKLSFDKAAGFNFDTSVYAGYTVYRGVELGLFASYAYMYRDGDTKTYNGQTVIWPTNITQSFRTGLQVTWKFD